MKNCLKNCLNLLCVAAFALACVYPASSHAAERKAGKKAILNAVSGKNSNKEHKHKSECFKHNIQLQLSDGNGFPVEGTQFWVTLDIIKEGNKVIVQFPVINFQTGPVSPDDPGVPFPGGFLYTSDGFLPKNIRPNDLVYRSILAASNNGASLPFSFAQPPSTLPVPPAGYILSITNAGAIVVQCAGTNGNLIPPGPQILMPADITYIAKPKVKLCKNYIIDPGFTNTTQFSNNDGIRDSHVIDAFDKVVGWAWTSNANIPDKANNTVNVFAAIGSINSDGTLTIGSPIQLSDLPPGYMAWDTAVAINRTNKNNIVVSYGVINHVGNPTTRSLRYAAVSFDGGKTWPTNGPINIQPTGHPIAFGDNRGVASDIFGNIWYGTMNRFDDFGNMITQPTFLVSVDGGVTYSIAYSLPLPVIPGELYDFPQYCFGEDGMGNYGLHFVVDYINIDGNLIPAVGFIPITGLGTIGSPSFALLTSLPNVNQLADITASTDGRVWTQGFPVTVDSYIQPAGIIFKSPGALEENYAGPWQFTIFNAIGPEWGLAIQESQPGFVGYIPNSPQSIIYDDARQALYALFSAQFPDNSQNARLYFMISRDNGQTWSNPIDIATTDFANRGFQSMALDTATGNLVFGWYDGRNDPTYKSVQYFGAIIPAKKLDKLVNKIPASNPLYSLPSAAVASSQTLSTPEMDEKRKAANKKRIEQRFGMKFPRNP